MGGPPSVPTLERPSEAKRTAASAAHTVDAVVVDQTREPVRKELDRMHSFGD
jgi:hypothetical protein